ncbi:MAG: hypothetical protein ACX930_14185 [Erythrobacter sp.]
MIDIFAILLVHGLLAVALWRLVGDDSVDDEELAVAPQEEKPGK